MTNKNFKNLSSLQINKINSNQQYIKEFNVNSSFFHIYELKQSIERLMEPTRHNNRDKLKRIQIINNMYK